MNDNLLIKGASCAVVTPFSDGELDLPALGRVLDHVTGGGVESVVICGTTGEGCALTDSEQQSAVAYAVDHLEGRAKVLSGASSNVTRYAAKRAADAVSLGAEGVLAVTPYYNKASEDGMVAHYTAIAEAVAEESAKRGKDSAGVILYNVPSRTGSAINEGLLERLAAVPNIVGIKEASGDLRFASGILARFGKRYAVYSGCDELNLAIMACGGAGCISVTANVMPVEVRQMCDAVLSGDLARATALSDSLRPITDAMFSEVNPIPVKAALADMGLCREEYRLPLCPMKGEKRRVISRMFRKE